MGINEPTVSVIIPTLNAAEEITTLLDLLSNQTYPITETIVVDSASDDETIENCKKYKNVRTICIERNDFDHGRTRDMALRTCSTDVVVFMTQDAVPVQKELIEKLIAPLRNPKVAVTTARQLPKDDAKIMERFVRMFNYPEQSHVRSRKDIPEMGIKAFFCSDVCAAYNRETYLKIGGFEYPIKTNEDMFFVAKALQAGYKVAYVAEAEVLHSHNFSLKEQYKRNYIQGYEIERHKELLANAPQESEGVKLVKYVSKELLKNGRVISFVHFGFDCVARLTGNRAGKKAARQEG